MPKLYQPLVKADKFHYAIGIVVLIFRINSAYWLYSLKVIVKSNLNARIASNQALQIK